MGPYYPEGVRNGHLDNFLGLDASIVALTSPLPGYASGYHDGFFGIVSLPSSSRSSS